MGENSKPMTAPPPCYAVMYPALAEIAKRHGYALAVHGSMRRDFDLLAVPWTENAGEPLPMIEEMKAACEGVYMHHEVEHLVKTGNPNEKPHGRRAWSIHLTNRGCNGPYLDISVMPRTPADPGEVSDGYHTFNELYEHRCTLFLALMAMNPTISWISLQHHDGSSFEGWFIAGMHLPTGDVSYHLPESMLELAVQTGAKLLERGPEWDGHKAKDVVERLQTWLFSRNAE